MNMNLRRPLFRALLVAAVVVSPTLLRAQTSSIACFSNCTQLATATLAAANAAYASFTAAINAAQQSGNSALANELTSEQGAMFSATMQQASSTIAACFSGCAGD